MIMCYGIGPMVVITQHTVTLFKHSPFFEIRQLQLSDHHLYCHAHALTHTLTHTHTHALTHTLTHSHTHTLTHTHLHTSTHLGQSPPSAALRKERHFSSHSPRLLVYYDSPCGRSRQFVSDPLWHGPTVYSELVQLLLHVLYVY